MSLIDRPEIDRPLLDLETAFGRVEDGNYLRALQRSDDLIIDLNEGRVDLADVDAADTETETDVPEVAATERSDDIGRDDLGRDDLVQEAPSERPERQPVMGMRLSRVRLRSVAKVAALFFVVAFLSIVGTGVALWNGALRLGLISDTENLITSALGLESFDVAGTHLFDLLLIGTGVLCLLGLVVTVLLAVVYNVAGMLFGGLAFETAPLQRGGRVAARMRHRLAS